MSYKSEDPIPLSSHFRGCKCPEHRRISKLQDPYSVEAIVNLSMPKDKALTQTSAQALAENLAAALDTPHTLEEHSDLTPADVIAHIRINDNQTGAGWDFWFKE